MKSDDEKPRHETSVGVGVTTSPAPARESDPDAPFRILVLGDFTARRHRGIREPASVWATRRPSRVDLDRLDELLGRWSPDLAVPLADGATVRLRLREMEDFRPERVAEAPPLAGLVAAESEFAARPAPPTVTAGLLDRVLGGESEDESAPPPPETGLGEALRSVLHSPAFRASEAAWRGAEFLVHRLDLDGTGLEVHLLDLSRPELEEALLEGDVERSPLFRLLGEKASGTPGETPWAALVLLESFGEKAADALLLARLARLGSLTRTPVLAGASPRLVGAKSLAETPDPDDWRPDADPELEIAWTVLRHLPETAWLALALPRFLLRLPYGSRTSSVEGFDFEELSTPPRHEEYLWGCPSLVLALLLGRGFLEDGWALAPRGGGVRDLPLAFETDDGDTVAKPCGEALLTIRAAQEIGEAGLCPLLTLKGTDTIQVRAFQSIAEGHAPPAGRWGG